MADGVDGLCEATCAWLCTSAGHQSGPRTCADMVADVCTERENSQCSLTAAGSDLPSVHIKQMFASRGFILVPLAGCF